MTVSAQEQAEALIQSLRMSGEQLDMVDGIAKDSKVLEKRANEYGSETITTRQISLNDLRKCLTNS